MNNKIENPKTETPKGMSMNDKDYITLMLTTLKDIEKNYVISLTEASNEFLYKKYYEMFESISKIQRKTYELMFKLGWYSLEKADNNKITCKYNMLNTEYNNLK